MTDLGTNSASTAPSTDTAATDPATLRALRDEARHLVQCVPGPLSGVVLRAGECELSLTWDHGSAGTTPALTTEAITSQALPIDDDPGATDDDLLTISAPLVGTFYAAPEPGAAPFVSVGDQVSAGATVGIVEAMKLLNPVVAPESGTVAAILVGNAEPVEFDETLIQLRRDAT